MRLALAVILIAGCDRVFGLDDRADAGDAQADACGTMFDLSLLGTLGVSDAADPQLSSDGRELFFSRNAGDASGWDIVVASRPALDEPFGPAQVVVGGSDSATDPALTADGLSLYFVSDQFQLYELRRTSIGGEWMPPLLVTTPLPSIASIDVSPDGQTLYATTGTGLDDALVKLARSAAGGAFATSQMIGQGTPFPTVDAGGQAVYFNSSTHDLWRAHYDGTTALEAGALALAGAADADISPDGSTLVLLFSGEVAFARRACQ